MKKSIIFPIAIFFVFINILNGQDLKVELPLPYQHSVKFVFPAKGKGVYFLTSRSYSKNIWKPSVYLYDQNLQFKWKKELPKRHEKNGSNIIITSCDRSEYTYILPAGWDLKYWFEVVRVNDSGDTKTFKVKNSEMKQPESVLSIFQNSDAMYFLTSCKEIVQPDYNNEKSAVYNNKKVKFFYLYKLGNQQDTIERRKFEFDIIEEGDVEYGANANFLGADEESIFLVQKYIDFSKKLMKHRILELNYNGRLLEDYEFESQLTEVPMIYNNNITLGLNTAFIDVHVVNADYFAPTINSFGSYYFDITSKDFYVYGSALNEYDVKKQKSINSFESKISEFYLFKYNLNSDKTLFRAEFKNDNLPFPLYVFKYKKCDYFTEKMNFQVIDSNNVRMLFYNKNRFYLLDVRLHDNSKTVYGYTSKYSLKDDIDYMWRISNLNPSFNYSNDILRNELKGIKKYRTSQFSKYGIPFNNGLLLFEDRSLTKDSKLILKYFEYWK